MILDTDEKTVTFLEPTVLTLEQIRSLADLLSDGLKGFEPDTTENDGVYYVHNVRSDNGAPVYAVAEFVDGTWACSCPDWTKRRSGNRGWCKHILRKKI